MAICCRQLQSILLNASKLNMQGRLTLYTWAELNAGNISWVKSANCLQVHKLWQQSSPVTRKHKRRFYLRHRGCFGRETLLLHLRMFFGKQLGAERRMKKSRRIKEEKRADEKNKTQCDPSSNRSRSQEEARAQLPTLGSPFSTAGSLLPKLSSRHTCRGHRWLVCTISWWEMPTNSTVTCSDHTLLEESAMHLNREGTWRSPSKFKPLLKKPRRHCRWSRDKPSWLNCTLKKKASDDLRGLSIKHSLISIQSTLSRPC